METMLVWFFEYLSEQFKSYYVVWKQYKQNIVKNIQASLNRTM